VPNYLCNIIIFYWIATAFRKTIVALNNQGQNNKSQVVTQMFSVYVLALLAVTAIVIYNITELGNEDKNWKSRAFFQNVFFMIFIAFIISYLIILRPSSAASSETFNVYSDLQSEIGDDEEIVQEENDKRDMEMTGDRLTENK